MGWKKVFHDQCSLPIPDEINKHRVRPGSLWECSTPGCKELWRYEGDNKFTPMEEITTTDYRPKNDNRSEDNDRMVPQPQVQQAAAIGIGAGLEIRARLEQRAAAASRVLEAASPATASTVEVPYSQPKPQPRQRQYPKLRQVRCACAFVEWFKGVAYNAVRST